MKKTILAASVTALAACSSMAQGNMTLVTSGTSHPVEFTLTGQAAGDTKVPVGNPAQVSTFGNLNVTVFSTATTGTALTLDANGLPNFSVNGWAQASPIAGSITFTAGSLGSTSELMANGSAGSPVQLEIVGWTGTATTFAQAEANALLGTALIGFGGSTLSGGALGWTQPTGTSQSPAAILLGATAYNTLVLSSLAPVPEPSTIALGGLAAAALLAFRRRK